ncbi:MAG: hypothetical protein SH848_02765 [Saprospiraceae bacterium]|nr:hypothetical protein [Saprospiraceae bacterium]MDZ4702823.1 hypothetical protein [Saprospiraceae bacterium]
MNYSTQILEHRNAGRNRALALLITVLVHAVVLGALFYSSLAEEAQQATKQDVATLDSRVEKP